MYNRIKSKMKKSQLRHIIRQVIREQKDELERDINREPVMDREPRKDDKKISPVPGGAPPDRTVRFCNCNYYNAGDDYCAPGPGQSGPTGGWSTTLAQGMWTNTGNVAQIGDFGEKWNQSTAQPYQAGPNIIMSFPTNWGIGGPVAMNQVSPVPCDQCDDNLLMNAFPSSIGVLQKKSFCRACGLGTLPNGQPFGSQHVGAIFLNNQAGDSSPSPNFATMGDVCDHMTLMKCCMNVQL